MFLTCTNIFRKYSFITKAVKNLQLNPNLESSFTVKKIYRHFWHIKKRKFIDYESMGFYIDKDKSLTWRGPMLSSALKQIYNQTKWGDLDYLIIDMPPGTGDAYLTIANEVNPDGIILVTTNHIMSAEDTLKSKITFNKLEIPILGFLINMYENSKGKYKMSAKELQNLLDVSCFGTIYFDNNLAEFKSQTITKVFKPIIELI